MNDPLIVINIAFFVKKILEYKMIRKTLSKILLKEFQAAIRIGKHNAKYFVQVQFIAYVIGFVWDHNIILED